MLVDAIVLNRYALVPSLISFAPELAEVGFGRAVALFDGFEGFFDRRNQRYRLALCVYLKAGFGVAFK